MAHRVADVRVRKARGHKRVRWHGSRKADTLFVGYTNFHPPAADKHIKVVSSMLTAR